MNFVKKYRNIFRTIILFSIFFLCSIILSYMFHSITCDEIWSYGFSFNISEGKVIYRDFNVVQTPLYFLYASLFIKLFGPHFFSTMIFHSIMMGVIGILLYKMVGKKVFLIFPIILVFVPSPYNLMSLFFLIWILYLIQEKKDNDIMIAFLVGLIFMTKQNIGILLFLPMIYYSKNKIKSIFFFSIPLFIISIYFIINGAFLSFIDYCFLGLFDFQGNNKELNQILLLIEIISVIYLVWKLLKSKFQRKDIFYTLMFQSMAYPILDPSHFFIALLPVLYILLKDTKKKIILYPLYSSLLLLCSCYYPLALGEIHNDKDLFYLKAPYQLSDFTKQLYEYLGGDIHYVYSNSEHAFLLKLYYGIPTGQYDMLLSGNMGIQKEKILESMTKSCEKENCRILLQSEEETAPQFLYFTEYVKENYKKVDHYEMFDVYMLEE